MFLEIDISARVPPVDETNPRLETWLDVQGRPCAYGQRIEGVNWMHFPGVGSYRFGDRQGTIYAVPEQAAPQAEVVDTYYRSCPTYCPAEVGQ